VIALIGSTSATALAAPIQQIAHFHGTICRTPTASNLDYTQYGVHNANTTGNPVTVFCPLPLMLPDNGQTIPLTTKFNFFDRGASSRVSCTQQQVNARGDVLNTQTKTSTSGGIGSDLQTLQFDQIYSTTSTPSLFIKCDIPPAQLDTFNNMWVSHIVNFQVYTLIQQ
jgi:hypothetical protein